MRKQRGIATLLAAGLIGGAVIIGTLIGKHAAKKDSWPEEAVEAYLETHGIDCEFSPENDKYKKAD